MKGWAKVKDLFWYSDSEPNEVLISMCHFICLPIAIWAESDDLSFLLMFLGACAGMFQLWAVIWNGTLKYRLIAVQIATLIAIMTIINLCMAGLMTNSRTGWIIIGVFAIWNTIRVFKEKIERG